MERRTATLINMARHAVDVCTQHSYESSECAEAWGHFLAAAKDKQRLEVGQEVTFTQAVRSGPRLKFLPGDPGWVVQVHSDRVRVRVPDTGEDGWLDAEQVIPR